MSFFGIWTKQLPCAKDKWMSSWCLEDNWNTRGKSLLCLNVSSLTRVALQSEADRHYLARIECHTQLGYSARVWYHTESWGRYTNLKALIIFGLLVLWIAAEKNQRNQTSSCCLRCLFFMTCDMSWHKIIWHDMAVPQWSKQKSSLMKMLLFHYAYFVASFNAGQVFLKTSRRYSWE